MVSEALQIISERRADHAYATLEIAHQVARHSAERQSSMKVFFVMAYVLEALGVDFGLARGLITFLMQ
jgi:hypothetical protein